jgi:hypothetical protein
VDNEGMGKKKSKSEWGPCLGAARLVRYILRV